MFKEMFTRTTITSNCWVKEENYKKKRIRSQSLIEYLMQKDISEEKKAEAFRN